MVDGGFRGPAPVRESASSTDTCLAFVRALDACWDQHEYLVKLTFGFSRDVESMSH
jgi:hypothetical protein